MLTYFNYSNQKTPERLRHEKCLCSDYKAGFLCKDLAKKYDTTIKTVHKILRRHNTKFRGHSLQRIPLKDRFEKRVKKLPNGCWLWIGQIKKDWGRSEGGYGILGVRENGKVKPLRAHRLAYQLYVGPIPEGKHLHHTCENKACVNPAHHMVVTNSQHSYMPNSIIQKGRSKTHCKRGHALTEDNVYRPTKKPSRRDCIKCIRIRSKKTYQRLKDCRS